MSKVFFAIRCNFLLVSTFVLGLLTLVLLLRMASFGIEDFAKKFGALSPSQFVDIISLVGDKADNIPGSFEEKLQIVKSCSLAFLKS